MRWEGGVGHAVRGRGRMVVGRSRLLLAVRNKFRGEDVKVLTSSSPPSLEKSTRSVRPMISYPFRFRTADAAESIDAQKLALSPNVRLCAQK